MEGNGTVAILTYNQLRWCTPPTSKLKILISYNLCISWL